MGLIPGVGAISNGEFAKAAVHVLILGLLLSLPFRALYTVPTGVVFGPNRAEVRRALEAVS